MDDDLSVLALARLSVMRSAAELERNSAKSMAHLDISLARVEVLLLLHFAGPQTPSALGRYAMTTRGNMSGLVDGLVRDGLVRRMRLPGDRRSHRAELTDAGNAKLHAYLPEHFASIRALMSGLTPVEARQLAVLLKKMRDGMRDTPELPAS